MPGTTRVSMFLCIVLCSKQIFAETAVPPASTTSPTPTVNATTLSKTLANSTVSTSLSSSTLSSSLSPVAAEKATSAAPTTTSSSTTTSTTTIQSTTARDCKSLSLDNGLINSTSLSASSAANFSCYRGYRLMGNKTLTCKEDGNWDGSPPKCEVIHCINPPDPANGKAQFNSTNVNSTVTYSCNPGYHLSANVTQTCQETPNEDEGSWQGTPVECLITDCHHPGEPDNGKTNVSTTTVNSRATFSCNQGYTLSGEGHVNCTANGSWSAKLPNCKLIECDYLGNPDNGKTNVSTTTVSSRATFSCNRGYTLSGEGQAICTANGSWSAKLPNCTLIECDHLGNLDNGKTNVSTTTLNSRATFSCNRGYTLSGEGQAICTANGSWSAKLPNCKLIDCGDLGNPDNGKTNVSTTTVNGTATFSCNPGYRLSGEGHAICTANGSWSAKLPKCTLIAVVYNDSCTPNTEDNPCVTHNATCNETEERCLCPTEQFHYEANDTCVNKIRINIAELYFGFKQVDEEDIKIIWFDSPGNSKDFDHINITVSPPTRLGEEHFWTKRDKFHSEKWTQSISNLIPGTEYRFSCYVSFNGIPSADSASLRNFTKPLPPPNIAVDLHLISETNITVTWDDNATLRYDYLFVTIKPTTAKVLDKDNVCETYSAGNCTLNRTSNNTLVEFYDLQPGHKYDINVSTGIGGQHSKVKSFSRFTKPPPPPDADIKDITSSGFTITWTENSTLKYDNYSIIIHPAQPDLEKCEGGNCTFGRDPSVNVFKLEGLTAGTNYSVMIYTLIGGVLTDNPLAKSSFTRPLPPSTCSFTNVTEGSFKLNWVDDNETHYSKLIITFSPNISKISQCTTYTNGICTVDRDDNITAVVVSGLNSGTQYNASIHSEIGGLQSSDEDKKICATYTVPTLPNKVRVPENDIRASSFIVYYDDVAPKFTSWNVTVYRSDKEGISTTKNAFVSKTLLKIEENILSGTEYKIVVSTYVPGFNSSNTSDITIFTRPSDPAYISIPTQMVHEDNFTINYDVSDERYDSLRVRVCAKNCTNKDIKKGNTSYTIKGLTAATNYSVQLYTVLTSNLSCLNPANNSSYSAPRQPHASRGLVDFNSVTLVLKGNEELLFDTYRIEYIKQGSTYSVTGGKTDNTATIHPLSPGTSYKFNVYSVLNNIRSDKYTTVSTFTRPASVEMLNITGTTNSSIGVDWHSPKEGTVDNYTAVFTCESPNSATNMIKTQTSESSELGSEANNLDPGTSCNVSITTHVADQSGEEKLFALSKTSDETAPDTVHINMSEEYKKSLYVSWEDPLYPNGVVRQYKFLVVDAGCLKAKHVYSTCKNDTCGGISSKTCRGDVFTEPDICDDHQDDFTTGGLSLSKNATKLHPYRNYTVIIQAFTMCWGKPKITNLKTKTDAPAAAPSIENITSNKTEIIIKWNPPKEEDANGVIIKYTIEYAYRNDTCWNSEDGQLVNHSIPYKGVDLSYILSSVRPYWFYNITLSASTSEGAGPYGWCDTCYLRTEESTPDKMEKIIVKQTYNDSANLSWSPPCLTNGILTKYTIKIHNVTTNVTWMNDTASNETHYMLENLLPYRNYTITLAAHTSVGQGQFAEETILETKTAKPRIPLDPKAITMQNATNLRVTWKTPNLCTGPTKYTVTVNDLRNSSINISSCSTGVDFNATECIVKNLDEYWPYKVTVIASTDNFSTSSISVTGRTAEAPPGNISQLSLKAEENVTKERSVNVEWNAPSERDKNGIITGYYIKLNDSKEGSVSNTTTNYSYRGMLPGLYYVQVFAATGAGNGTVVKMPITVSPGAPIKVTEKEDSLLMQPSKVKLSDDERQIAVKLPLKDLLCNIRNGQLTRWGVIVAQENQATDKSFSGSITDFQKKVSETYKSWFQVNDMDSIPPYIATPRSWSVQCPQFYSNRRKRSATTEPNGVYTDFVVGDGGKCSGEQNNKYCNGELQPGRSYRVKSFACTVNGCTETEYSKPIATVPLEIKASDPTVPIVAGVSSAIVVIAVVVVVMFVLRRKQLACFAKDDESLRTHTPSEGIHMDKIEPTRKNAFRQGPIKLSDFPDTVENMHKDSDLLFADAYKLLKEKSPSHPMTAAEQQCCRPKNRYTNILPFDHSRVKLRPSDDIEGSDYINANYIPGYTSRREYIATQGAMQATFDDFWRMIWEQNVDTIVMLTKLMEKGRHKCDKYWPDLGEPVFYGDLVVSLQSESNLSDYTIKIFEVKMKEERKMVRHFSYLKWPDMGCPDTPELLLEFVKAVRQYTNREKRTSSGPTVVHCSAGVGRTGTFIAVDYLLQHIRDHDEVDIFNFVLEMRNQRLNMVQTEDQYVYIHECLKAFITTDEEEEDEEDDHVYVNTSFGAQEENIYVNSGFEKE